MKIKRVITIEETIEDSKLNIHDLNINGKRYSLRIHNDRERLQLGFYEGTPQENDSPDFLITLEEKGIRFERHLSRPNHDHDDSQTLQVVTNPLRCHRELNTLFWESRFPYQGEGRDFFYIPFGSDTSTY